MNRKIIFISVILLALTASSEPKAERSPVMKLSSPAFEHNAFIPVKFTCQGEGVNPALIIENTPEKTQSLALIIDDLDAPRKTFVHWVVCDIPVTGRIEENSIPGKQGANDAGGINYVGPCPPTGVHRYFFKVYALDKLLNLKEGINKPSLEGAMRGHILDQAELIGLYEKK